MVSFRVLDPVLRPLDLIQNGRMGDKLTLLLFEQQMLSLKLRLICLNSLNLSIEGLGTANMPNRLW